MPLTHVPAGPPRRRSVPTVEVTDPQAVRPEDHSASVAAVVITHNRVEQVTRCIESLYQSTYPLQEIIVVDNASTDGTPDHLRSEYPMVRLIEPGANLLTSAAANLGIAASKSDYILVMADDNVVAPDMVYHLLTGCRGAGAGLAGPKMLFQQEPRRLWSVGATISLTTSLCHHRAAGEIDTGQCDDVWEPDCVHNALLLARWAIEVFGLFDDRNFPMHNEEADLCARARKAGIRVVTIPQARLWHNVDVRGELLRVGSRDFSVESPFRAFYTARNRTLLVRKHGTRTQSLIFFTVFMLPITVAYLGVILTKRNRLAGLTAYLKGCWAGLRDPIRPTPMLSDQSQ